MSEIHFPLTIFHKNKQRKNLFFFFIADGKIILFSLRAPADAITHKSEKRRREEKNEET
jgi:hypothetical protein